MLTRSIELKKRLRAGETAIGGLLSISSPAVAEIMAGAGFDWVLIETEHSPFTLESLQSILMAFNGRDTVPLVRVPWNDQVIIKQVLDLGAEGIMVPHVGSPEEARQAVAACRYPPEGIRGYGPWRASDYYRQADRYARLANEGIIVLIQIEHIDAVRSIGQILAVPGIDVVLLGPMDLSGSLGLLGQLDHPQVVEAINQVIAEANRADISAGIPGDMPPEVMLQWVSRGCQFVFAGEDHGFLRRTVTQTLTEFRQHLSGNAGS